MNQSLIKLEPLSEIKPPDFQQCDWLFFVSPKSVALFTKLFKVPKSIRLGSLSVGTAKAVKTYLKRDSDFTGSKDLQVEAVAKQFSKIIKEGQKVLIPVGDRSNGTIQKELPSNCYTEFVFYSNNEVEIELEKIKLNQVFISSNTQLDILCKYKNVNDFDVIMAYPKSKVNNMVVDKNKTILINNYQSTAVFEAYLQHK